MEFVFGIIGAVGSIAVIWVSIIQLRAKVISSTAYSLGGDFYSVRMKIKGSKLIDNHFTSVRVDGFLSMPIESFSSEVDVSGLLESELPIDLFVPSSCECNFALVIKRISSMELNRPEILLSSSSIMLSIHSRAMITNAPDPANRMIEFMNEILEIQNELDKRERL